MLAFVPCVSMIFTDYHQMDQAGYLAMQTQWSMAIAAAYDFSGLQTLIDVGGGVGTLLAVILKANPGLRGILVDLPYILDDARALVAAEGLRERCTCVVGDLFEAVPPGADAYMLKAILHDWDDERAVAILQTCHRALQGQSKLLVVERLMPERADQALEVVLTDLEMLVMAPGGRERTAAEFRALFAAAGFTPTQIVRTQSEFSILEGVPV